MCYLWLEKCFGIFASSLLGVETIVFTRVSSFAFTWIASAPFDKLAPAPLNFDGTQEFGI
jgi:hypothetical protein